MKKNQFTLVEVLISSAIVTTSAIALYSAMFSSRSAVMNSRLKERATVLVNQKLEELAKNLYRDVTSFGRAEPEGVEEEIMLRTYSAEDYKSKKEKSDFTPNMIHATMFTQVEQYISSCKIIVEVSWGDNKTKEDKAARTVRNHVFKYETDENR